jgi:hypothetical protein
MASGGSHRESSRCGHHQARHLGRYAAGVALAGVGTVEASGRPAFEGVHFWDYDPFHFLIFARRAAAEASVCHVAKTCKRLKRRQMHLGARWECCMPALLARHNAG